MYDLGLVLLYGHIVVCIPLYVYVHDHIIDFAYMLELNLRILN